MQEGSGSSDVWALSINIIWKLVRMQVLGPHPNLLNLKSWEWGPAICASTSHPGNSDTHLNLRTTALGASVNSKHSSLPQACLRAQAKTGSTPHPPVSLLNDEPLQLPAAPPYVHSTSQSREGDEEGSGLPVGLY